MLRRWRQKDFVQQSNHRRLPDDYTGDLCLWDIDKTYLDTAFSSLRGLVAIPFETAVDKRSVRGSVPVLRALRRGSGDISAMVPLYFVSASPPQLRNTIERRMTYDGVDFDGITFKDQLGLLLKGRPKALLEQVGYKLTALLMYRLATPKGARWLLFGDDVEADAAAFCLFGDICAGLRDQALSDQLRTLGVLPFAEERILKLTEDLPITDDPIVRVFIHLERKSDPGSFKDPRVVATRSYLQTALVLADLQRIRDRDVLTVARDLRLRGVADTTLAMECREAMERLGVRPGALERLGLH